MTPRRAFTLVNIMVSVAVIAILAGLTVVSLEPDDRARVIGAAQLLASDLEYAQALSLSDPHRPAVLRLDDVGEGYWIAYVESPDDPILDAGGDPAVVVMGQGRALTFAGVDITIVSGATDGWIEFDGFGRLTELRPAVIRLTLNDESRLVVVSASTGFVDITIP